MIASIFGSLQSLEFEEDDDDPLTGGGGGFTGGTCASGLLPGRDAVVFLPYRDWNLIN